MYTYKSLKRFRFALLAVGLLMLLSRAASVSAQVTVNLTAPRPGQLFTPGGSIAISANASAPPGYTISKVEFFHDTTLIGTDTSAPYSIVWSNVPHGSYILSAKATAIKSNQPDQTGTSSGTPISVSLRPQVTLVSPTNGDTLPSGLVSFTAEASDPDGTITMVRFHAQKTSGTGFYAEGIDVTQPPYEAVLPLQPACCADANGNYHFSIWVDVVDNDGALGGSPIAEVLVPKIAIIRPAQNATFTAPASISIETYVINGDGSVTSVDFYNGSTFIGRATSAPFSFTWTGVPQGGYSITARATDGLGVTATSAPVAITVTTNGASVTVTSPAPGAVIASDSVTVSGTFSGPNNSGIAANGVVAAIVGDTFVASNVPLQPGGNTLTVTLTTPNNQTATQTLSVTSTGPAVIEVLASPTQGVAPLSVTFTINNRTGNAIQSVQADYSGTGGFATVDPRTLSNTYTASGIYQATFIIIDSTGASYQQSVPISVQDTAQIDQMLQTAWWGFATSLATRDTAQALQYFNAQAQQKFQSVFQTLATDLPQIVSSFSAPQLVSVTSDVGEYAINRTIDGVDRIFFVYFLRDVDGVWRIDDM